MNFQETSNADHYENKVGFHIVDNDMDVKAPFEEQISDLKIRIEAHPRDFTAMYDLATIYQSMEQLEEAGELFKIISLQSPLVGNWEAFSTRMQDVLDGIEDKKEQAERFPRTFVNL